MTSFKLKLLLLLLLITEYPRQVTSECPQAFPSGDVSSLCYAYKRNVLSWTDAYNQCLAKTVDGALIQVFSTKQFYALKAADVSSKGYFWLGANNFASFRDSQWHWLDGSVVDKSVITWCPNSTYDTAIGTYCAAYDSASQCITNFLCNTLLPAPCVAMTNAIKTESRSVLTARLVSTGTCTNSYGGAYANWWTYTLLLLNWFILFCFILYLSVRFDINKRTVILTMIIGILSFMMIIAFAILWGVQYQDILQIPLIVVILGCVASLLFLFHILILIWNRRTIQRSLACVIVTIITIVLECGLMIGIIICIASCSNYISLTYSSVDKGAYFVLVLFASTLKSCSILDIIASLLAGIMTAISIAFYTGLLYFMGDPGSDRIISIRTTPNPLAPTPGPQQVAARRPHHNNEIQPGGVTGHPKKYEQIDRATSPVDERILEEFYADHPKDMHQYHLEGRQYVVYEGKTFSDVEPVRNDLTQAMLSQERRGLREAIARAKGSPHASTLADEIRQAEDLLNRLK
ncbi:unnamed protein product [Adineta ricciae]|uniref:C-type lectin domain-containing protein n=1 Tax=Adineta ricciae TaxID=249248 RepID=A0A815NX88_ADIRI|nr:unnamed protein product [Adineta ricciae]